MNYSDEEIVKKVLAVEKQLLGQLDPEHDVQIMVSRFDAAETLPSEHGDNLQL